ncbi:MAG: Gfo/Idh/MocA family protein [Planctomycetota bacterium]
MKTRRVSRREFLGGAAASAFAFAVVPGCVLGGPGKQAPSDTLNVAGIGCGGKGGSDVRGMSSENIVALCDVSEQRGGGSFRRFPKARKFKDYRVMLDEMDKAIDAVTVSTPDHSHAPAALRAMRRGKHCFTQKPLTHSPAEARAMAETARKMQVATVMGIQRHCSEHIRREVEMVRAGWLGPVREVHIWTNRPIWHTQGLDRPKRTDPVPPGLDWDLWLGPAPYRPYVDKVTVDGKERRCYHPFAWRGWWDFGTGALGDIGCHALDHPFWAFDLCAPTRIEAETSPVNDETYPAWSIVTYQFPARGDHPPLKLVWYDGGKKPPRPPQLEADRKLRGNGQLWIGDKATMFNGRVIPETKLKELMADEPPETLPRSPGIYKEFIRACKGGPPCGANFPDYAGPLTEIVLAGNLAVRTGQPIEWDGEHLRCTNLPAANRYIRREYRSGWEL